MKILVVCPYLPYPPHGGNYIRIMEILKFLQPRHEITVICFISSATQMGFINGMLGYCKRVIPIEHHIQEVSKNDIRPRCITENWSPKMQETLLEIQNKSRFDVVDFEHIWTAQYASLFSEPTVLHEHNIESQVLRRYAEYIEKNDSRALKPDPYWQDAVTQWPKLCTYETSEWPKFASRVTVSELDRLEMITRCKPGQVVSVPNGVDIRAFPKVGPSMSYNVLFTGSMLYQPNLDAALELCDVIWPIVLRYIPHACLYIVGNCIPSDLVNRQQDGLIEVISNAQSLLPYAANCSISVVPIRVGGGTRAKILTSMALGLPVISTSVGCEGLDIEEELIVVDEPAEFAHEIVRLLNDRARLLRMAQRGRAKIEIEYDWLHILPRFEHTLEKVVNP